MKNEETAFAVSETETAKEDQPMPQALLESTGLKAYKLGWFGHEESEHVTLLSKDDIPQGYWEELVIGCMTEVAVAYFDEFMEDGMEPDRFLVNTACIFDGAVDLLVSRHGFSRIPTTGNVRFWNWPLNWESQPDREDHPVYRRLVDAYRAAIKERQNQEAPQ